MKSRGVTCFLLMVMLQLVPCSSSTPDNNAEVADLHLYDGDIVLSEDQQRVLLQDHSARARRAVVTLASKKWLDGIVPYELSPHLNDSAVHVIHAAMQQLQLDSGDGVRFVPKLPYHLDYLHIFPGDGCFSQVGRQGGEQNVSINYKCEEKGVVMHELFHALGRWHEQSRRDRNTYVRINRNNIKEDFLSNFNMIDAAQISTQGLDYDYSSIMHYDAFAFSDNDLPTIEPLDSSVSLRSLGQRDGLSSTDEEHLRLLYPSKYAEWSRWSQWSDCSASCGSGSQQRTRQCLGSPCLGSSVELRDCYAEPCPTEKPQQWGSWGPWGGCSRSCGGGVRVRLRSCLEPEGNVCEGEDMMKEDCNTEKCPEVAEWSEWSSWSPCSTSCGGGWSQRSRVCRLKGDKTGGGVVGSHLCAGHDSEKQQCVTNISCGITSAQQMSCNGQTCYKDTCLTGLVHVGCYLLPPPTESTTPILLSTLGNEPEREQVTEEDKSAYSLKDCGKFAHTEGCAFFGLQGGNCYGGISLEVITRGGSLVSCNTTCEDCFEVFQITEQVDFELSVSAFESCGADYCLTGLGGGAEGEGLSCSGSRQAVSHLTHFTLIAVLFLWRILC